MTTAVDETRKETDEDKLTRRLNKTFESRLDLDRVSGYNSSNCVCTALIFVFDSSYKM